MTAPKVDPPQPSAVQTEPVAVARAVSRSWPSMTRPRLPTESEERLYEIDRRSAACYAGMETLTEKLGTVLRGLEAEDDEPKPEPCKIIEKSETWDEDSLVQSMDEFRQTAAKPRR